MRSVEIDANSGFCGGVIRAISTAEKYLSEKGGALFSLGSIVHNEEELSRLSSLGLVTVSRSDLGRMRGAGGGTLLIRAHGEPPEVYRQISDLGLEVIDCTCPVVLKLQKDIREAAGRLKASGGTVVIFGKIGHPEVLGLVGQVEGGSVVVVEDLDQLETMTSDGHIRTDRDIELFSQTTKSPSGYAQVRQNLSSMMSGGAVLSVHETICAQVASRHRELSDFALSHDIVIFVAGKSSSNGKVLCDLCKSLNIRTFHISSLSELQPEWFRPDDRVGVSGATSTPKWLLEQVARAIENLQ